MSRHYRPSEVRKHVASLERRARHLEERVLTYRGDPDATLRELAALRFAIDRLTPEAPPPETMTTTKEGTDDDERRSEEG